MYDYSRLLTFDPPEVFQIQYNNEMRWTMRMYLPLGHAASVNRTRSNDMPFLFYVRRYVLIFFVHHLTATAIKNRRHHQASALKYDSCWNVLVSGGLPSPALHSHKLSSPTSAMQMQGSCWSLQPPSTIHAYIWDMNL